MKIEDIYKEWDEDSSFDVNSLTFESAKIPKLHAKYRKILSNENLLLIQYTCDYKELYKEKFHYFSGKMTKEELFEKGLPQFQLTLAKDIQIYIDADPEIIILSKKIGLQKEKVSFLESIMSMINGRQYQIRNALEDKKFNNGGY